MFTILNILHLLWHVGLALVGGVCGAKILDKIKKRHGHGDKCDCGCEHCCGHDEAEKNNAIVERKITTPARVNGEKPTK